MWKLGWYTLTIYKWLRGWDHAIQFSNNFVLILFDKNVDIRKLTLITDICCFNYNPIKFSHIRFGYFMTERVQKAERQPSNAEFHKKSSPLKQKTPLTAFISYWQHWQLSQADDSCRYHLLKLTPASAFMGSQ